MHVRIILEDFLDYKYFLPLANCLKNDGETYGHASSVRAWIIPSVVPHLKCESIYYAKLKKKNMTLLMRPGMPVGKQ